MVCRLFLGQHRIYAFRSAILAFVGRDAAYLAEYTDGLSGRA